MSRRRLSRGSWFFGVALVAAQLSAYVLWAKEPPARVQTLYRAAVEARSQQDWAECARLLERAVEEFETPGLRFHLAFCLEQTFAWKEALTAYKRVQHLLDSGQEARGVAHLVRPAIEHLLGDMPRVRVKVLGPATARLSVNGSTTKGEKWVSLDPGKVTVVVSAQGYQTLTRTLVLLPGEKRTIKAELASSTLADRDASADGEFSPRAAVITATSALSALALGAGGGWLLTAHRRNALVEERRALLSREGMLSSCPEGDACGELSSLEESRDRARSAGLYSLIGAGAGLAITAGIWALWSEDSTVQQAGAEGAEGQWAFGLSPWGASLGGAF